ncbi:MAG: SecD/SecF family protein translocase subunit, partial [Candidatus Gracilibacteria bacterium]|nr:SecD/SecF family protein translocase subunit [Candidatus Gracilibacteria bacterium]
DAILTGKAVITGNYTSETATKLSQDINTGVVPAPIYLTSERTIDSKLGLNSLNQLIIASVYGFLLIFLFLVVVYRLSGFTSSIALFIYTLLILAVVKGMGITLTLASIAGLVLSIGMAIDSNILIFARIKEELALGHKIEKAVQDGFDRSWSAIWDTHLTGFITSIVLFIFGINMIKGFGLMLGIGLLVSFFMTMVISKLFILLLIRKKDLSLKCFLGVSENK